MVIPPFKSTIIVSATVSFAPDDIPSMYGPAIGLLKKHWSRNPDTESPPPRRNAAAVRGSLISVTIRAAEVCSPLPASTESACEMVRLLLPTAMLRMKKITESKPSMQNPTAYLTALFLSIATSHSSLCR